MARQNKNENLTIEERLEAALVPEEEQPYEVPGNWCWTSLSQIANWGSGGTPTRKKQEYFNGNIPWIKTGELEDNYIYNSEEKITEEAIQKSSAKLFPADSVLIAMYGATIGKTAILGIPATTNQACACAQCKEGIYNKYLFLYLQSQKDSFIEKGQGGAQPNISQDIIKKHSFPIAPFKEQHRIVNRIESLFSQLDEARDKAQEALDGFEERKISILHKAFSGELTKKWRDKHNTDISSWGNICLKNCGDWFGGGTPKTSVKEYWEGGNIPWITSKDMKEERIDDSQLHITMEGVTNSSANYCEEPAVLFVMRSGILRRVFPVCMVNVPFTVNQDLKAVIPHGIEQEYLFWACTGFEKDIREKCMKDGTTVESIEAKKLLEYQIPLAPIEEQREITQRIDKLLKGEEQAKRVAEEMISEIEALKKSILAKAFRGELGTNDPEDENAIELIKKILKEQ